MKTKKKCKRCGLLQGFDNFHRSQNCNDGLRGICKSCVSSWGKLHRVKRSKELKEYRQDPVNKYKVYKSEALRKYGITVEQIQELMNDQRGCCAICGSSLIYPDSDIRYAIDHDHDTGGIRGLLCRGCNVGIGALGDTLKDLENAYVYLGGVVT